MSAHASVDRQHRLLHEDVVWNAQTAALEKQVAKDPYAPTRDAMAVALLELEDEPQASVKPLQHGDYPTMTRVAETGTGRMGTIVGRVKTALCLLYKVHWDGSPIYETHYVPEIDEGAMGKQVFRFKAIETLPGRLWVEQVGDGREFQHERFRRNSNKYWLMWNAEHKANGAMDKKLATPNLLFDKPDAHLDIEAKSMPKPTSVTPPNGRTPPSEEKDRVGLKLDPKTKPTNPGLNEQKAPGGISWTRVDGRRGYTWNPIAGCQHGCKWRMPDGKIAKCYAETIATGVAIASYPDGFDHHYYKPDRLNAPHFLKDPSGIFLDSMSDLMGAVVPEEQILDVLKIVRECPQHIFQLLTKNAPRLLKFKDEFPDNLWVGVSMPPTMMFGEELSDLQQQRYVEKAQKVLSQLDVPVRWWSFEPLSFDVASLIDFDNIEWAVIGAASNGRKHYQPNRLWVKRLLARMDNRNVPVYFKSNLAWTPERKEFPKAEPVRVVK